MLVEDKITLMLPKTIAVELGGRTVEVVQYVVIFETFRSKRLVG